MQLPLKSAVLAFFGATWSACSLLVVVLVGWDLVRSRRFPSAYDAALVIAGPISLVLATRLALRDQKRT